MREKIFKYLEKDGRPLAADRILREALNVFSRDAELAERILAGIVAGDPRFLPSDGLWSLAPAAALPPGTPEIAALYLQSGARHPGCFRGAVYFAAEGSHLQFERTGVPALVDVSSLEQVRRRAEGRLLLVWSGKELTLWNRLLRSFGLAAWEGDALIVNRLAARVLPGLSRSRPLEDLRYRLDLTAPETESMPAMARFLDASFRCLMESVPADRRTAPAELESWIAEGEKKVDFSRFGFDRGLLARIPESPGVYLMRDRDGKVIYIGQSGNLRRRLRSYFTPRALEYPKVARIHELLHSLEHVVCATEVDALLLEMRMIRDFRPEINLQSEIHERPASCIRGLNLLLLVPAGEKAEVYLLRAGVFAGKQSVRLGHAPPRKLCSKIRSLYFGTRRRRQAAEPWETEIVARWVAAHGRRVNFVDVDEAGTCDSVLLRLESYLKDPDRLSAKVYYR